MDEGAREEHGLFRLSTPAPCLSPQIPSRTSSSMFRHGRAPAYKSEGHRIDSDGMSTTTDPNSHPLASLGPSHVRRGMLWRYRPPGTLTGASCTNHPPRCDSSGMPCLSSVCLGKKEEQPGTGSHCPLFQYKLGISILPDGTQTYPPPPPLLPHPFYRPSHVPPPSTNILPPCPWCSLPPSMQHKNVDRRD